MNIAGVKIKNESYWAWGRAAKRKKFKFYIKDASCLCKVTGSICRVTVLHFQSPIPYPVCSFSQPGTFWHLLKPFLITDICVTSKLMARYLCSD
jgi:hypothetical protein